MGNKENTSVIALKEQAPEQIVDIAPFPKEYEVYPEGARAKASFIWPKRSPEPYDFCIPSRMYLFKTSRPAYPEQFWVEIFSYQLGCLIGIPVPPAFVAYDSSNKNVAGALIQWFYNQDEDEYKRGGDVMKSVIENYDIKRGTQHNINSIFNHLKTLKWGQPHWKAEWAKIIIFDALIGNSDRHQDNWGIVTQYGRLDESTKKCKTKAKRLADRMSPAFDNGTSMGHEFYEKYFHRFKIEKYVKNGKPHIKWDLNEDHDNRDNHEEFIRKILKTYPECRKEMRECLNFSEEEIREILQRLMSFNISPCLTQNRAQFMLNLILFRQRKLISVLDEHSL